MGIIKNAINWGTGFNIQSQGPIDSRSIVEFKRDLTDPEIWNSEAPSYVGMLVSVLENSNLYILTDSNFTIDDNWKEIGIDENIIKDVIKIKEDINNLNSDVENLNKKILWIEFE